MNRTIREVSEDLVGIESSVTIVLARFGLCHTGIFDTLLFTWSLSWVPH